MINITMNELFSGIGAQIAAMKRMGVNCKVVGISDIDKYANQSYMAINGETRQYGDICKIARLDYADLWTYSFPCQDLSIAGKQAGIADGTRSGLLLEVERLLTTAVIEGTAPKFLLLENVKNLVSKKFKPDFEKWLQTLETLGYRNYWKVLNAKDYGVPQNRERVFVMSIRKDIECDYKFPQPVVLTKRLKDVLEPQVDEKYYLSDKVLQNLKTTSFEKSGAILSKYATHLDKLTDVSGTLMARDYKGFGNQATTGVIEPLACASRGRNPDNPSDRTTGSPTEQRIEINTNGTTNTITTVQKDNYVIEPMALDEQNQYIRQDGCVGTLTTDGSSPKHNNRVVEPKVMQEPMNLYPNSGNPQAGRVYNTQGISPAMDTCQGGNRMPKVIVDGYFKYPNSDKKHQSNTVISKDGISTTLDTMGGGNRMPKITEHYRIRKLTPRECWRLMGFTDEEFNAAQASGISNSQLYKQAGNSIVVDVLVGIFKSLFEGVNK